jgi:glycerophosphoryl diester phosphodiesterase
VTSPVTVVSAVIAIGVAVGQASGPSRSREARRKQVVAHRGASAYAPEHTLPAYRLAIEQGADFVEQDLAVTKDGVLVCIHDLTLDRTTNVEDVFPNRFNETATGSTPVRGWLVGDFTLAEIKQLDAGAWFAPEFAGARIPTFQEAIDLVKGRAGLYPELKDPAFYRERNVSPERLLAALIEKNGLASDPDTPLVIQSFDESTIRMLSAALPDVRRVWLIDSGSAGRVDTPGKLEAIAIWTTGIAPHKGIVATRPEVVTWAHAAGLSVTPWTFRSSNAGAFASVRDEMARFLYEYDVDALFTDNPDQFPRR